MDTKTDGAEASAAPNAPTRMEILRAAMARGILDLSIGHATARSASEIAMGLLERGVPGPDGARPGKA